MEFSQIKEIYSMALTTIGIVTPLATFVINKIYDEKKHKRDEENKRYELNHTYKLKMYSRFITIAMERVVEGKKNPEVSEKEKYEMYEIVSTSFFFMNREIHEKMMLVYNHIAQIPFDARVARRLLDDLTNALRKEF